jgi:hypothetical protein
MAAAEMATIAIVESLITIFLPFSEAGSAAAFLQRGEARNQALRPTAAELT